MWAWRTASATLGGLRTASSSAAHRLADYQRGQILSRPDGGHGQPGGPGMPGSQLYLGREDELGDQAVTAGWPAELDVGVAADYGARHGRQSAAAHGGDLEPHRAAVARANLEREELPVGAERTARRGAPRRQFDRGCLARCQVEQPDLARRGARRRP